MAIEFSPVEPTGVINEELGIDRSNWDVSPSNIGTFTLTELIFPTLLISRGSGPVAPLTYAPEQIDLSALPIGD